VATLPKPWLSEPQGISLRYFDGRPLGLLLATIRQDAPSPPSLDDEPSVRQPADGMLQVLPIGRETHLTAPATGTLCFRINDSWSELADNEGTVEIRVQPVTE
jgi:hypothetical protein